MNLMLKIKQKMEINEIRGMFLTSPLLLSIQGCGLIRSSVSESRAGPSASQGLEADEQSDGGTGELEGHSRGIMHAGINASTTASLNTHYINHLSNLFYKCQT